MYKSPLLNGPRPDLIRVGKKYTPVGDKVALQVLRADSTPGGVILPDGSPGTNTPLAWVVAVGPEVKWVREGDLVLAPEQLMCIGVNYDGDRTMLVHEKDLIGFVDSQRAKLDAERPTAYASRNPPPETDRV